MHGLVLPHQPTRWLSLVLLAASVTTGCAVDDPGSPPGTRGTAAPGGATSDGVAPAVASLSSTRAGPPLPASALSNAIARHRPPEPTAGPLVLLGVAPSRPAITTDDERHLLFELVLQNTSTASVALSEVDVIDRPGHAPLASYRDAALAGILTIAAGPGDTTTSLAPGGVAVAFFDIVVAPRCALPEQLIARFTVRQGDAIQVQVAPTVAVIDDRAPPLGPPLHGDHLLDLGGCCDGGHRRALLGVDGGLFLAQRFAIDWVRIDDQATFAGDPTQNESYFLFGADVVSVGRGRVVETSDGMAENVPTQPPPPPDIQTATGNHVVIQLDDGRFTLYAHLQTGSVRVHPGDRVERGQLLGLVGNTGNSTEPHLHFHVMDGPSPLVSDGLPYRFDRFDLTATVDISTGVPVVVPVPPPQRRRDRLPLGFDVVQFRH